MCVLGVGGVGPAESRPPRPAPGAAGSGAEAAAPTRGRVGAALPRQHPPGRGAGRGLRGGGASGSPREAAAAPPCCERGCALSEERCPRGRTRGAAVTVLLRCALGSSGGEGPARSGPAPSLPPLNRLGIAPPACGLSAPGRGTGHVLPPCLLLHPSVRNEGFRSSRPGLSVCSCGIFVAEKVFRRRELFLCRRDVSEHLCSSL